ncbi:DHA2 family efflux MFS transporter permease subunit [Paludibacterium paludis]|uniref:MFS transporter n=1 Tax=Paludibacterium paludis TaxID=1225769 RepID=A0A918P5X6_9NEIS|nr:DHA2 family efflux MFS transporter permease subunit [Paludibacterium paludis]GGY23392.1 MFS transporter [Paludibacterium paludis]
MSTPAPAGSFHPASVGWTTAGLALAVFMQVLDGTIANVALPAIAGNLGVGPGQSTWVVTGFAASHAIALPLTGFLVRRVGLLRLFLWATALFTLASLLCGLAPSMETLVLCRMLQGAVAGPMIPTTQALMLSIHPPERRGFALSMIAMVTVAAPIAGPLLGGWITDSHSWRWAFLINLPVGLFACLVVAGQMRGSPVVTDRANVDIAGLVALIAGVGSLQVVLDKGNEADWFESPLIVTLSVMAVAGIVGFLFRALTARQPIVNLRLFRHRNFAAGVAALVLAYSAFYAVNVIMPLWLQRTLGYTPTLAGLAIAPMGILPVLLTPFMGKYAPRINLRLLVCAAFVLLAGASFLRAGFPSGVDFAHIAQVQLLQGLGLALFIMPINAILLSDLKPEDIAAGSGLSTFLRTLGASLAVSLTTLIWDRRTVEHRARLAENLDIYDAATRQAIAAPGQGGTSAGLERLAILVDSQAAQLAFNDVAGMLGVVFLAAIALVWLARPPFVPKTKT